MNDQVLERKSFSAGSIILRENDTNKEHAYIIQSGEVKSFITDKSKLVQVGRYGPGEIIAETCLVSDTDIKMNYQALSDVNVVVIQRHDFEKKMSRLHQTIQKVFGALVQKIEALEKENSNNALEESRNDEKAIEIVEHLLRDMSDEERKNKYEEVLLPHFNVMCRALEVLKKEDRHKKQKEDLDKKVSELKETD